jgi:hypothetical protein
MSLSVAQTRFNRSDAMFLHKVSALSMPSVHTAFAQRNSRLAVGSSDGWWLFILIFVMAFAIAICLFYASQTAETIRNRNISQGYNAPIQKLRSPPQPAPPAEGLLASVIRQSLAAEPLTPAQNPTMPTTFKPTHASQVDGSMASLPPPLWRLSAPPQSQSTFLVNQVSLLQLYDHQCIEIQGSLRQSIFARLARSYGGSRLEVSPDASFDVGVSNFASVGPLDYPANLSSDASLHGPGREYYGPFQRFQQGFAIGHFSRASSPVFVLMPRQNFSGGLYVEAKSGKTTIGTAQSSGNGYQIVVRPGIDPLLVLTSIIAAFVASQPMIDETGTTI